MFSTIEKQAASFGKQSAEKKLLISRLWNEGKITKNEAAILAGLPTTGAKGDIYKIRSAPTITESHNEFARGNTCS